MRVGGSEGEGRGERMNEGKEGSEGVRERVRVREEVKVRDVKGECVCVCLSPPFTSELSQIRLRQFFSSVSPPTILSANHNEDKLYSHPSSSWEISLRIHFT